MEGLAKTPREIVELYFRANGKMGKRLLKRLTEMVASPNAWYEAALLIEPFAFRQNKKRIPLAQIVFEKIDPDSWQRLYDAETDTVTQIHIGQFIGRAPRRPLTKNSE
ncbi:MAG: hypothetical protein Greene041679_62 [Parcubacteria group bacterium Greene0416_79]|nr:MAG: hypothetical protein Greene041679_62 [Parcubacteria group bacterium Greene0416_79]